jgi:glucose-6-phosphate 1-epimerase
MHESTSASQETEFSELLYGLPCLRIESGSSHAFVARQGAQVLSWHDKNGKERLYLSSKTLGITSQGTGNVSGHAIRGGIPVCFPQFSDRGPMIKHGFVRNRLWATEQDAPSHQARRPVSGSVILNFKDDETTRAAWPHAFHARVEVKLEQESLTTSLTVINTDDRAISFTVALHTYLQVDDIRQVQLAGLEGIRYQDATNRNAEDVQRETFLKIEAEVDRVYGNTPGRFELMEGGKQSLGIEQHGFADTVVWNPGPEKARALSDFPDDDWLKMLCIEAACVMQPVELQPGQTWTGSQVLKNLL